MLKEIVFVKEIGSFALDIFTSLFTNKIDRQLENKEVIKNFNNVDTAIINEIGDKISDEYYKEKLQDQIMKDRSFLSNKICFISQDEREEFIDNFYKKNPDLKYVGSKRINECLNSYIDMINDELNKKISYEGKVIISRIKKSEKNIIKVQNYNTKVILEKQESNTNLLMEKINDLNIQSKESIVQKNYNMPSINKVFYGREDELKKIVRLLSKENIIIINGFGGIGKTQIAKKYILDHKDEYCLIVWISVENLIELNDAYRKIALFYGLIQDNKRYDQDIINELVKSYLDEKENSIITIDGIDDVEFNILIDYLPVNSKIIITTQNSNLDSDEFAVIPIGDFSEQDAVNFLLSKTSTRKCTSRDEEDAKKLITLMQYYPLAIEYARAHINKRNISIKEYIELYQSNTLSSLNSKLPSYKKTTYTAWKISFDKAVDRNEDVYTIMSMCSYFASVHLPFREIFSLSNYSMAELVNIEENMLNYSLISIDGGYINIHGIIQGFIREMLDKNGESIKFLKENIELLKSYLPQKINNIGDKQKIVDVLPHARRLFNFCIDKNISQTNELGGEIGIMLYGIGMYLESIEYMNLATKLCYENKIYFRFTEYSTFLIQAHHYTGNSQTSLNLSKQILEFIDCEGDFSEDQKNYLIGNIKGATGIVQKDLGEIDDALDNFKNALICYEKIGDTDGQINQLNNIGIIYKYKEEYDLAMKIYETALELCKEDKRNKSKILGNIGFIYRIQHNIPKAYTVLSEALVISQEIGDLRSECIDYHHIAECWIDSGKVNFALENLKKSYAIAKKINYVIGIINIHNSYGLLYLKIKNDISRAKEYFKKAFELSNQIEYAHGKDYSNYYLNYISKKSR